MKASKVIEPKEPFSDRELEYIFKATELKTDGHGFKVKCTGQPNAWEILVFIWTLRYTGLRISDVVRLERRQLVPFKCLRLHARSLVSSHEDEGATGSELHTHPDSGQQPSGSPQCSTGTPGAF
jgi:hypothetical protein